MELCLGASGSGYEKAWNHTSSMWVWNPPSTQEPTDDISSLYVNTIILSPEGKLRLYIGYVLFSTKYDHLF